MGISSRYTKGIEIEIGGNATKLKTALDSANRSIRTTQMELGTLKNSLRLEWNADQFKRAQELAQREIKETTQKAELLEKALAAMGDKNQFSGTQREQYEAIRRELSYVQTSAQKARDELKSLGDIQLDGLKTSISEAGERLNALGNKLTAGLTAPLAAAGAASFNYASDTDEALNKVETAFGTAADGIKRWSDSTLASIGLAKGTALDMAALYGDMSTSMGFADDEAAGMSKTLVNLAADLSSFKNIGIAEANTALKSIFTGETESLKNLGVVMTQTNLEAYAMAQGFQTAYKDMDQAQQVAVRYQYVLDMTKNAQGDFARTSDGAANQVRILQESLKEAAAVAGSELLPMITPMIENLSGMVQGFADLDEGTRKAVVQAGLFVAALGPALKLTSGLTTAVNAGITAYHALTAAQTSSTAAQTGLNVAMTANPIGTVVAAAGALVAVLGSFAVTAALSTDKNDSLTSSVERSRQAYEEAADKIREEQADTVAMISTLENLAAQEEKTAAQKDAILSLVDQLNEAVPDLSLAYDEQTDSLNLTTDALLAMAEASAQEKMRAEAVDKLSEAYKTRAGLAAQLADAEAKQAEQQALNGKAAGDAAEQHSAYTAATELENAEIIKGIAQSSKLAAAQWENEKRIADLEAECGKLTSAQEDNTQTVADNAQATGEASAQYQAIAEVLTKTQGAYELLTKAEKEMNDSGYLSISTVSTLIDKYPDLTRYLAEASDGYQLADGALADYIATQRAEYQIALDDAAAAARAVVDAESQKRGAVVDTTLSIEEQLLALAALYDAEAKAAGTAAKTAGRLAGGITGIALPGNLLGDTMGDAAQKAAQQQADGIRQALDRYQKDANALKTLDRTVASLGRDSGSGGSGRGGGGGSKSRAEKEADPGKAAMEELDAWLEDMNHKIFLWAKDDEKTEAVAGLYQQMQARVHGLAETFRKQGYSEDSEEIQKLQKLWWGYSDEMGTLRQSMYERDLAGLQEAQSTEQITWEDYLEKRQKLQDKYLRAGTEAWKDAEEQRQQEIRQHNQSAYDEQLADLEYFHDMDLVSEEAYWRRKAELRDQYLAEDAEARRRADVEIYNHEKELREKALKEAEEAYEEELGSLKEALDDQLSAAKDAYNERLSALREELSAEKAALKERYDADKAAAKESYEAKKAEIQKELALEKARLNAIIDGIDAEIQARRELREDEGQDDAIAKAKKRLEEARAELSYARTDEDKAQWEKEIVRRQEALEKTVQDKEDTAFYRQKEEEKEGVRDQISAAEEKAKAAQESAQSAYDAQAKKLESEYNAKAESLEAEYQAKQEQAKLEYERMAKQLKSAYEKSAQGLRDSQDDFKKESGGGKQYSDEVRAIAHANDVDLGVAQDMYNANQRYKGDPGYKPYSDGGYKENASKAAGALAGIVGAVVSGGTSLVGGAVSHIVNSNNRSANVTVNGGGKMTEGQIARTVEKIFNKMGR